MKQDMHNIMSNGPGKAGHVLLIPNGLRRHDMASFEAVHGLMCCSFWRRYKCNAAQVLVSTLQ